MKTNENPSLVDRHDVSKLDCPTENRTGGHLDDGSLKP